jgi:hypothetical protein
MQPRHWFRAKRFGWGWGLPLTWEGWVALALFGLLSGAGHLLLPLSAGVGGFTVWMAVLCAALLGVCWWKGEPLRRPNRTER